MATDRIGMLQASTPHPASLPGYIESYVPSPMGYGSLNKDDSVNFYREYRNEVLSRFMMPPFQWGYTRKPYSPRSDIVADGRKLNWKRILELPKVTPLLVDKARAKEVDNFYQLCQLHREQYFDHSGNKLPLEYFQIPKRLNTPPETNTERYLSSPSYFVQYKQPFVLPRTYGRTKRIPNAPDRSLAGLRNAQDELRYTR